MSLTDGISFFKRNKALFEDGSAATASTGDTEASLIIGTNKFFKWSSVGSDDTTVETITITLDEASVIDRIFLADHNWKEFTVKYDSGTEFTTVVGIDGALGGGIAETAFVRDTAYYEFDSVTVTTIEITITKTQTVDAEKTLVQLIATEELGTLTGFPKNNGVTLDRNEKSEDAVSGRMHVEKGYESARMDLVLKTYASGTVDATGQADIDLLDSLHDSDIKFIVWANGGVPSNFRFEQRGWRLKDVYQMQTVRGTKNAYDKNVYVMGVNQRYSFVEVS